MPLWINSISSFFFSLETGRKSLYLHFICRCCLVSCRPSLFFFIVTEKGAFFFFEGPCCITSNKTVKRSSGIVEFTYPALSAIFFLPQPCYYPLRCPIILYYTLLHPTTPYYTLLHRTVPYYSILHPTILCYTIAESP